MVRGKWGGKSGDGFTDLVSSRERSSASAQAEVIVGKSLIYQQR